MTTEFTNVIMLKLLEVEGGFLAVSWQDRRYHIGWGEERQAALLISKEFTQ